MSAREPTAKHLGDLTDRAFIQGWTSLVGEPPAALFDDRRAMIAVLVEASGIAQGEGRARQHAPSPVPVPDGTLPSS